MAQMQPPASAEAPTIASAPPDSARLSLKVVVKVFGCRITGGRSQMG
jgi:hypothetical protein